MNEERLNAFEKMLSDILAQYDSVTDKLASLKAEGKEKTVTYRQLFTNKLQYQTILSYYRIYGFLENDKKWQKCEKALDNKLGLISSAELDREEERISKKKAVKPFEKCILDNLPVGKYSTL